MSHDHESEQITPERLWEAAEAALLAAAEIANTTGHLPYPPDLMGSSMQPDFLAAFTRWEIQQASEFLVRMGMLDAPGTKRAA